MRKRLGPPRTKSELLERQRAVLEGLMRASELDRELLRKRIGWAVIERSITDIGATHAPGMRAHGETVTSASAAHPQYRLAQFWRAGSEALRLYAEEVGLDPDYIREAVDRAGLLALVLREAEAA